MKNPSDAWEELRRKVLGLGDSSVRKTHYPSLRRRLAELERLRAKVKLAEFHLAEGQRLAHMGSWAFDPDGFYYWSPELFRMHGLDPASKPPGVQEYLNRVHPHDRESMADLIKGVLAKASPFDATKRIVRPNGEVRYIRCVSGPVIENQSLKKYVGSAIDVTEHELLTHELRRREAYLTEAQSLSHTGSFGWRPDTGEFVGAVTDITERKTAEEALRSSEAYLAEAQRLSHTVSWAWSPDTDVRHW